MTAAIYYAPPVIYAALEVMVLMGVSRYVNVKQNNAVSVMSGSLNIQKLIVGHWTERHKRRDREHNQRGFVDGEPHVPRILAGRAQGHPLSGAGLKVV